jgi:molybdopterin converting factor small subunit
MPSDDRDQPAFATACSALTKPRPSTGVQLLSQMYAHVMQVRVRLGAGLSRLSAAPLLTVELADGATLADLYARLRETEPGLAPALRSALPVVAGEHVPSERLLVHREEVALLLPISGG